jgi:hypothetical protein
VTRLGIACQLDQENGHASSTVIDKAVLTFTEASPAGFMLAIRSTRIGDDDEILITQTIVVEGMPAEELFRDRLLLIA